MINDSVSKSCFIDYRFIVLDGANYRILYKVSFLGPEQNLIKSKELPIHHIVKLIRNDTDFERNPNIFNEVIPMYILLLFKITRKIIVTV